MGIATLCLLKWTIEPSVPFLFGCQEYRHGLGMDWAHSVVRISGPEREELILRRLSVHSQKEVAGTRQRHSALSQPRQSGDLRLRTLVTGALPAWEAPDY